MARLKDKSVRDVVDASNIVEVVGLRTSLRKSSGTRYMGRCPFHEERSASFSVNSDLNLYHCFGCGKGGNEVGDPVESVRVKRESLGDQAAVVCDRWAVAGVARR